jgi:hypothetical protein
MSVPLKMPTSNEIAHRAALNRQPQPRSTMMNNFVSYENDAFNTFYT